MNDSELLAHIKALVDEEHTLENTGATTDEERARLKALEVSLDQCWDLLRQRRARREYGENPDDATVRPPDTVERYQQ